MDWLGWLQVGDGCDITWRLYCGYSAEGGFATEADAVSAAVVCGHKSGGSLNHLELAGQNTQYGVQLFLFRTGFKTSPSDYHASRYHSIVSSCALGSIHAHKAQQTSSC